MSDLQALEQELVGEIAAANGIKGGKKPEEEEGKKASASSSDGNGEYVESLKDRLAEVVDLEANAEDVNSFLDEVKARLDNGEALEDVQKDIEAQISELKGGKSKAGSESGDDEDVIPASKHKKALDSMQRRIDELYAQNKAMEARLDKKDVSNDSRLEHMTEEELKSLSEELLLGVSEGNLDGRELDIKGKREALALNRKVQDLLRDAPQRFERRKIGNLEKVLPSIEKIVPDIYEQIQEKKGKVFDSAMRIHSRLTSLQKSELGYADAFVAAVEQMQALPSKGEEQLRSVRAGFNKLKQKVSLARAGSKGEMSSVRSDKLFDAAKQGGRDEQERWILETQVKPLFR